MATIRKGHPKIGKIIVTMQKSPLPPEQMKKRKPFCFALFLFFALFLLFCHSSYGISRQSDKANEKKLRDGMVEKQLVERGIKEPRVLQAIRTIPRHLFVPEKYTESAYGDFPLPIGYGQTIPQPYIGALMSELLEAKKTDVALEIGTGSGYQAAVLGPIVKEVYTIEIIPQLGEAAGKRFEKLGFKNITLKIGDGYLGWNDHAPFDRIIVTAVTTHVPPPLIQQLKNGGKMVIPIGNPFQIQNLMLIEKSDEGTITTRSILPVRFAPLIHQWK